MRWFKHLVASKSDPDIGAIIDKFGYKGYFMFFRTLEIMSDEFSVETPAKKEFNFHWFLDQFPRNINKKSLMNFYDFCQNSLEKRRILYSLSGDKIIINFPKLKDLTDDYTARILRSKSEVDANEVRTESEKNPKKIHPKKEEDRIQNIEIEDLSKEDKEILNLLKNTKNYPYNYEKDIKFIRDLGVEFSDIDVFEKIKQICANWMDKPLLKSSRPRVQIRKWCLNERKWAKERKKDLMVGKSQREPTEKDKQFRQEYEKKRQELEKKHEPELEKARKDGNLKMIGEVDNKIKQELAEWSNKYWKKK